MNQLNFSRRSLLSLAGGSIVYSAFPLRSSSETQSMDEAIRETFGKRPILDERVTVKLPPISENGYSVPITVHVDSPMTADDYIKQITVFSPRNPLPILLRSELTPFSGKASITSRIRLSGTQTISAIAESNSGTLYRGQKATVVTLAACVIL